MQDVILSNIPAPRTELIATKKNGGSFEQFRADAGKILSEMPVWANESFGDRTAATDIKIPRGERHRQLAIVFRTSNPHAVLAKATKLAAEKKTNIVFSAKLLLPEEERHAFEIC